MSLPRQTLAVHTVPWDGAFIICYNIRMREMCMERISVLIASYRNVDLLRNCIESLVACCRGSIPEIVVVDDAAGDIPTAEYMKSCEKYGVKFAVTPENRGFAGANN